MQDGWQAVLDNFAYGIYLITIADGAQFNGMVASWLMQCCHEPPMLAVAIRHNRLSHEQIRQSRKFCVNLVDRKFESRMPNFKRPDWQEKFKGQTYYLSPAGLPVLDDALGFLDCRLEQVLDLGDHSLFVAQIISGDLNSAGTPLTTADYSGVYRGNR